MAIDVNITVIGSTRFVIISVKIIWPANMTAQSIVNHSAIS